MTAVDAQRSAWDAFVFTFFNGEVARQYLPDVVHGLGVTLAVSLCIVVTGVAGGLALAMLRASGRRGIGLAVVAFADIFRALPPLVLLMLFFFAFPFINLSMSAFTATWLALSLVLAAYAEESIWAGLAALPAGQREAARSCGMSAWQALVHVQVPQALRMAVPPLTNRVISVVKNTALGSVIALNEVLNHAQSASSNAGNPTPLVMGAAAYLLLFIPVVLLARWLEARWPSKR
ncbi:MAG: putative glutamine ABC transporter permease protein GlnP [Paracidovorax wautersii]|uniref:Putative glutamine ABC transporter permease protein GlnP n=1 Tax=Paracidovorax wautersii TaxID=1177982 RepID=A0A7V8FLG2_9BURK|nr:MAG: putative glutamine ABC transporter permease protein GlnP [Paracidovorax wautersii]